MAVVAALPKKKFTFSLFTNLFSNLEVIAMLRPRLPRRLQNYIGHPLPNNYNGHPSSKKLRLVP
jgi:hypothetical protein